MSTGHKIDDHKMVSAGWKKISETQWERPIPFEFGVIQHRQDQDTSLTERITIFLWEAMIKTAAIAIPVGFFAIILCALINIILSVAALLAI